jgi:hypothetical protein
MDADPTSTTHDWQIQRLWPVGLGLLVLVTSLAVASVSVWLLLPYLVLTMLMLFGPSKEDKRSGAPEPELREGIAIGAAEVRVPRVPFWHRRRRVESQPNEPAKMELDETHEPRSESEPEGPRPEDPPPPRPKSRKRAKTQKPASEPLVAAAVEVVWVRVGPNQYVRKEVAIEADETVDRVEESEPPSSTTQEGANIIEAPEQILLDEDERSADLEVNVERDDVED